jgi:Fe-S-cluster containining protein
MKRLPTSGRRRGRSDLNAAAIRKADRLLLRNLEEEFDEARRVAGERLVCKPGCDACCHGPFPVNRLDAARLRRGLRDLERQDPERARAVRVRAQRATEAMRQDFPGEPNTGVLSGDEAAEERFSGRHAALPCPALDPASGRCDLYDARPVPCRTFGPPVRFGGTDLPPCRLCFEGAPAREIESCRLVPDAENLEGAILNAMESPDGEPEEQFIAHILAR